MKTKAQDKVKLLQNCSYRLRLKTIDVHRHAGAGHLGSSLSVIEILTVLFHEFFRWREEAEECWRGDRFILSKGHAALGLYSLLETIDLIDTSLLLSFGSNGSALEPHPNEKTIPEIHASTGSLGQGLSIGVGMALGSKLHGTSDRTFVIIGDGEVNEGQIWEAARCAAYLRLSNLLVVLDDNRMQQDGPTPDIMPVSDVVGAWRAMGWQCISCDGHDCGALMATFESLLRDTGEKPKLLHAQTIKGRGIDYLEGRTESHFPPPMTDDEYALVQYMLGKEVTLG